MSGANLSSTEMNHANLRETNLRKANLQFSEIVGADLSGADLTGASWDPIWHMDAIVCNTTLPDGKVILERSFLPLGFR